MYQEAFRSDHVIIQVLNATCLEIIKKRTKISVRKDGGPARESQMEPQGHESTVIKPHIAMGYSEEGHLVQIQGSIPFSQAKMYQHYLA